MNLSTLNRWHRTIQLLEARPRTKAELIDRLESEDFKVSARTVERDLSDITNALGLPIVYDRARGHYRLGSSAGEDTAEIKDKLDLISRLAQSGDVATQLVNFAQKGCLRLDPIQPKGGTEYLQPLLEAADRGQVVRLMYQSFERSEPRAYTFEPALLTEWGYRWYACGYYVENKEVRVFALDRIHSLERLPQARQSSFSPEHYRKLLEPVIGITLNASGEEVDVVLRATPVQSRYLASVPLHLSQRMEGDKVYLRIRPNPEFYQQIIRLGAGVEVLSPQPVRDEVARQLKEAWEVYDG